MTNADQLPDVQADQNAVYFYTQIDQKSVLQLKDALASASRYLYGHQSLCAPDNMYVDLHISSYGGSAMQAFAACDMIKRNIYPVRTFVDGVCASGAAFMSICGAERHMDKHALILLHNCYSYEAEGWYSTETLDKEARGSETINKIIRRICVENTSMSKKSVKKLLKKDRYIDAEEALSRGMIDKII